MIMLHASWLHNTQFSDGRWRGRWRVRHGTAIFDQGLALQRPCFRVNTPSSVVAAVVMSSGKSWREKSQSGRTWRLWGRFRFCFVCCFVLFFNHLPVVLLLLMLSTTPFLVSANYSMVQ